MRALMLTMLVNAWEDRDVATVDVSGAYLYADMDDYTLLKLEGEAVEILCSVAQGGEFPLTNDTDFICMTRTGAYLFQGHMGISP